MVEETSLKRNNLLTTLPSLKKLFKISFDMMMAPSGDRWQSVLHLSQGGKEVARYGTEVASIFIGSRNYCEVNFAPIAYRCDSVLRKEYNKWVYVEMEQKLELVKLKGYAKDGIWYDPVELKEL